MQLPIFESFASDEVPSVRQSLCISLPAMCRRIDSIDYRRHFAVKMMTQLCSSGEMVRGAALEVLGEIIWVFDKDPRGPPIELLKLYLDDSASYGGFRALSPTGRWSRLSIYLVSL